MTTLTELNGRAWYRFLKVLYILFYLLGFLLLFLVLNNNGKDYHSPILPDNVQEALKDPDFYKLNDYEMKNVLSSYYNDLLSFSYDDNTKKYNDIDGIIKEIKTRPIPTNPLNKKYHYRAFYTWNIGDCIKFGLIVTINYILIMECIRRGIYYALIGRLFPKE